MFVKFVKNHSTVTHLPRLLDSVVPDANPWPLSWLDYDKWLCHVHFTAMMWYLSLYRSHIFAMWLLCAIRHVRLSSLVKQITRFRKKSEFVMDDRVKSGACIIVFKFLSFCLMVFHSNIVHLFYCVICLFYY